MAEDITKLQSENKSNDLFANKTLEETAKTIEEQNKKIISDSYKEKQQYKEDPIFQSVTDTYNQHKDTLALLDLKNKQNIEDIDLNIEHKKEEAIQNYDSNVALDNQKKLGEYLSGKNTSPYDLMMSHMQNTWNEQAKLEDILNNKIPLAYEQALDKNALNIQHAKEEAFLKRNLQLNNLSKVRNDLLEKAEREYGVKKEELDRALEASRAIYNQAFIDSYKYSADDYADISEGYGGWINSAMKSLGDIGDNILSIAPFLSNTVLGTNFDKVEVISDIFHFLGVNKHNYYELHNEEEFWDRLSAGYLINQLFASAPYFIPIMAGAGVIGKGTQLATSTLLRNNITKNLDKLKTLAKNDSKALANITKLEKALTNPETLISKKGLENILGSVLSSSNISKLTSTSLAGILKNMPKSSYLAMGLGALDGISRITEQTSQRGAGAKIRLEDVITGLTNWGVDVAGALLPLIGVNKAFGKFGEEVFEGGLKQSLIAETKLDKVTGLGRFLGGVAGEATIEGFGEAIQTYNELQAKSNYTLPSLASMLMSHKYEKEKDMLLESAVVGGLLGAGMMGTVEAGRGAYAKGIDILTNYRTPEAQKTADTEINSDYYKDYEKKTILTEPTKKIKELHKKIAQTEIEFTDDKGKTTKEKLNPKVSNETNQARVSKEIDNVTKEIDKRQKEYEKIKKQPNAKPEVLEKQEKEIEALKAKKEQLIELSKDLDTFDESIQSVRSADVIDELVSTDNLKLKDGVTKESLQPKIEAVANATTKEDRESALKDLLNDIEMPDEAKEAFKNDLEGFKDNKQSTPKQQSKDNQKNVKGNESPEQEQRDYEELASNPNNSNTQPNINENSSKDKTNTNTPNKEQNISEVSQNKPNNIEQEIRNLDADTQLYYLSKALKDRQSSKEIDSLYKPIYLDTEEINNINSSLESNVTSKNNIDTRDEVLNKSNTSNVNVFLVKRDNVEITDDNQIVRHFITDSNSLKQIYSGATTRIRDSLTKEFKSSITSIMNKYKKYLSDKSNTKLLTEIENDIVRLKNKVDDTFVGIDKDLQILQMIVKANPNSEVSKNIVSFIKSVEKEINRLDKDSKEIAKLARHIGLDVSNSDIAISTASTNANILNMRKLFSKTFGAIYNKILAQHNSYTELHKSNKDSVKDSKFISFRQFQQLFDTMQKFLFNVAEIFDVTKNTQIEQCLYRIQFIKMLQGDLNSVIDSNLLYNYNKTKANAIFDRFHSLFNDKLQFSSTKQTTNRLINALIAYTLKGDFLPSEMASLTKVFSDVNVTLPNNTIIPLYDLINMSNGRIKDIFTKEELISAIEKYNKQAKGNLTLDSLNNVSNVDKIREELKHTLRDKLVGLNTNSELKQTIANSIENTPHIRARLEALVKAQLLAKFNRLTTSSVHSTNEESILYDLSLFDLQEQSNFYKILGIPISDISTREKAELFKTANFLTNEFLDSLYEGKGKKVYLQVLSDGMIVEKFDKNFINSIKLEFKDELTDLFNELNDDSLDFIFNTDGKRNPIITGDIRQDAINRLESVSHQVTPSNLTKFFKNVFNIPTSILDEILDKANRNEDVIDSSAYNKLCNDYQNVNYRESTSNDSENITKSNPYMYLPITFYEKGELGTFRKITKYIYAPNLMTNEKITDYLDRNNKSLLPYDLGSHLGRYNSLSKNIGELVYIYGNQKGIDKFKGRIDFNKPFSLRYDLQPSTRIYTPSFIANPLTNKLLRDVIVSSYPSNIKGFNKIQTHKSLDNAKKDKELMRGIFFSFLNVFGKDVDKLNIKNKEEIRQKAKEIYNQYKDNEANVVSKIQQLVEENVNYVIQDKNGNEIDLEKLFNDLLDLKEDAINTYIELTKDSEVFSSNPFKEHPFLAYKNHQIFMEYIKTKDFRKLDDSKLSVYMDGASTAIFENMIRLESIDWLANMSRVYNTNLVNETLMTAKYDNLLPNEAKEVFDKYIDLLNSLEFTSKEVFDEALHNKGLDPYILGMAMFQNEISKYGINGNNLFASLVSRMGVMDRDAMKKFILPYVYGAQLESVLVKALVLNLPAHNSAMYNLVTSFKNTPSIYQKLIDNNASEKEIQRAFKDYLAMNARAGIEIKPDEKISINQVREFLKNSTLYNNRAKTIIDKYLAIAKYLIDNGELDLDIQVRKELPIKVNIANIEAKSPSDLDIEKSLFSNSTDREFTYQGKKFNSVSQAYQALKDKEIDNEALMIDLIYESLIQNREMIYTLIENNWFKNTNIIHKDSNQIKAFKEAINKVEESYHLVGTDGYYNRENKTIRINSDISTDKLLSTLIHEINHALYYNNDDMTKINLLKELNQELEQIISSNQVSSRDRDISQNNKNFKNISLEDIKIIKEKFNQASDTLKSNPNFNAYLTVLDNLENHLNNNEDIIHNQDIDELLQFVRNNLDDKFLYYYNKPTEQLAWVLTTPELINDLSLNEELNKKLNGLVDNLIANESISVKGIVSSKVNLTNEQKVASIYTDWFNSSAQELDNRLSSLLDGVFLKDDIDYKKLNENIGVFTEIYNSDNTPSRFPKGIFKADGEFINRYAQFFSINNKSTEFNFDECYKSLVTEIMNSFNTGNKYDAEKFRAFKQLKDFSNFFKGDNFYFDEKANRFMPKTSKTLEFNDIMKRTGVSEYTLSNIIGIYNIYGEFLPEQIASKHLMVSSDLLITQESGDKAFSMKNDVKELIYVNLLKKTDEVIERVFKKLRPNTSLNQTTFNKALKDSEFVRELDKEIDKARKDYYDKLVEQTFTDKQSAVATFFKNKISGEQYKQALNTSKEIFEQYKEEVKDTLLEQLDAQGQGTIETENTVIGSYAQGSVKYPRYIARIRRDIEVLPDTLGLFNHNLEALVMQNLVMKYNINIQIYDGMIIQATDAAKVPYMWNTLFSVLHDEVLDLPSLLMNVLDASYSQVDKNKTTNSEKETLARFYTNAARYLIQLSKKEGVTTKNINDLYIQSSDISHIKPKEYSFVVQNLAKALERLVYLNFISNKPELNSLNNPDLDIKAIYGEEVKLFKSKQDKVTSLDVANSLIEKYGKIFVNQAMEVSKNLKDNNTTLDRNKSQPNLIEEALNEGLSVEYRRINPRDTNVVEVDFNNLTLDRNILNSDIAQGLQGYNTRNMNAREFYEKALKWKVTSLILNSEANEYPSYVVDNAHNIPEVTNLTSTFTLYVSKGVQRTINLNERDKLALVNFEKELIELIVDNISKDNLANLQSSLDNNSNLGLNTQFTFTPIARRYSNSYYKDIEILNNLYTLDKFSNLIKSKLSNPNPKPIKKKDLSKELQKNDMLVNTNIQVVDSDKPNRNKSPNVKEVVVEQRQNPQTAKDIAMTNDSDISIVIWNGKSKGTKANIDRAKLQGKPVYNILDSNFKTRDKNILTNNLTRSKLTIFISGSREIELNSNQKEEIRDVLDRIKNALIPKQHTYNGKKYTSNIQVVIGDAKGVDEAVLEKILTPETASHITVYTVKNGSRLSPKLKNKLLQNGGKIKTINNSNTEVNQTNTDIKGNESGNTSVNEAENIISKSKKVSNESFIEDLNNRKNEELNDSSLTDEEKSAISESYDTLTEIFENAGEVTVYESNESNSQKGLTVTDNSTQETSIVLFKNQNRETALHEYIHSLLSYAFNVVGNEVNNLKHKMLKIMQQVKQELLENPNLMNELGLTERDFNYIFNNPDGIDTSIHEFVATFLSKPKLAAYLASRGYNPTRNRFRNLKGNTAIGTGLNVLKALLGLMYDLVTFSMIRNKGTLQQHLLNTTKALSEYNTAKGIERKQQEYQNSKIVRANKAINSVFHLATRNIFKSVDRYVKDKGYSQTDVDNLKKDILSTTERIRNDIIPYLEARDNTDSVAKKSLFTAIAIMKAMWHSKSVLANPIQRNLVVNVLNELRQQMVEGTFLDFQINLDLGLVLDKGVAKMKEGVDRILSVNTSFAIEAENSASTIREEIKNLIYNENFKALTEELDRLREEYKVNGKKESDFEKDYETALTRYIFGLRLDDYFFDNEGVISSKELSALIDASMDWNNTNKEFVSKEITDNVNYIMTMLEVNNTLTKEMKDKFRAFLFNQSRDLGFTRLTRLHNKIGLQNSEDIFNVLNGIYKSQTGNDLVLGKNKAEDNANYRKLNSRLHKLTTLQTITQFHENNSEVVKSIREDSQLIKGMYNKNRELKSNVNNMISLLVQIQRNSQSRNDKRRVLNENVVRDYYINGEDISDRVLLDNKFKPVTINKKDKDYNNNRLVLEKRGYKVIAETNDSITFAIDGAYKEVATFDRDTRQPYYMEGYIPYGKNEDNLDVVGLNINSETYEQDLAYYLDKGYEIFTPDEFDRNPNEVWLKYKGIISYKTSRNRLGFIFEDRLIAGKDTNTYDVFNSSAKQETNEQTNEFYNELFKVLPNKVGEAIGESNVIRQRLAGSLTKTRTNMSILTYEKLMEPDTRISSLFYAQEHHTFNNQTKDFINNQIFYQILLSQDTLKSRMKGKYSKYHHTLPLFEIKPETMVNKQTNEKYQAYRIYPNEKLFEDYGISFSRDDLANFYKLLKATNYDFEKKGNETIYVDTRMFPMMFGFNNLTLNDVSKSGKLQKSISGVTGFFRGMVKETRKNVIIRNPNLVFTNFKSNLIGLIGEGIPQADIWNSIPVVISQLKEYQQLTKDKLALETKLASLKKDNPSFVEKSKELSKELNSIKSSLKNHALNEVIENGFYTNIVQDSEVSDFKWDKKVLDFIQDKTNMSDDLKAYLKEFAITEDSETYNLLADLTRLGDFVPRVIYYNHLKGKLGMNTKEAIAKARDKFVNYNTPIWSPVLRNLDRFGLINYAKYATSIQKQSLEAFAHSPIQASLVVGGALAAKASGISPLFYPSNYIVESLLIDGNIPKGLLTGEITSFVKNLNRFDKMPFYKEVI